MSNIGFYTGGSKPESSKSATFKVVKDENVMSYWQCEDCGGDVGITPDWYEQNGTPVCCECDRDMSYCWTKVRVN